MSVSYNGFDVKCITFEKKPSTQIIAGDLVAQGSDGYIEKVSANAPFFGVASCVRDNFVTVQISGYAELEYTGSSAPSGLCKLVSNGAGKVSVDSSSTSVNPARMVLKHDEAAKKIGVVL